MEMQQNAASEMPNNNKKKNVLIALAVLAAAVVLGIWWWRSQPSNVFNISAPPTVAPDSSSAINQEVEGLDIGDLDAEFQQIDAELNQL